MSKIDQTVQGDMPSHIFKCYCGEFSYLEIILDKDDQQIYFAISMSPTTLWSRVKLAWRAIHGLEFSTSNEVIIDGKDVPKIIKALKELK
jgi:hypothetical protein